MAPNQHTTPPFRAEHMGSLLRPASLLSARAKLRDDPTLTPASVDLPSIEKSAISSVVSLQRSLGFRCLTSGEFTRTRFWGLFWDELSGTTRLVDAEADLFRLYHPDVVSLIEKGRQVMPGDSVIAGAKVRHPGKEGVTSNLHELKLVQEATPREEWAGIKITMITPAWFHMRYKQGRAYTSEAYSNDAEYFADVAKAYQKELEILYEAGLRNVQFDDPGLAYFCSKEFRQGWAEDSDNIGTVDDLLDAYIKLYNDCISKCPSDMHVGVHLCRGNFIGGRHFASGAYDIIARKLFNELNAHTFYLEYDTERAGGFEPLAFLPTNKNVIIGAISTKLPQLENKEEVKQRIMKAAEFVAQGIVGEGNKIEDKDVKEALKRMGVSPQCGFSTHETGYPLSEEDEKAKLQLVREIADEIWGGEP